VNAAWSWLYDASGADFYAAHSLCLTNDPIIMTLYAACDLTIFCSYVMIGITLLVYRRYTMRFSTQALFLYGSFIFLCGLTHLSKVGLLFVGAYRFDVVILAMTAGVSAVTASYTIVNLHDAHDSG
jgi:hypothetical protein